MKRKFLIILIAIVCAVYCAVMFSACAVKEKVDDTVNNSSVTDQTNDSNGDGNGENSETPETPENPESGDEDNDKPTAPGTTEGDGQGDTGSTGDTGETVEPDTPDTGNTPNTGDAEEKQDEYIYTKENGWNTQLLAKTLEDWMIENDYYNTILQINNGYLKKILYFDKTADNVNFSALCYIDEKPVLQNFKFRQTFFDSVIDNLKNSDFVNILNDTINGKVAQKKVLKNSAVNLEYSSLDDDFDIHKEEFETLTNSVISRLSGEGAINNSDIFSDIFENSQIVYGFKTKASDDNGLAPHLGNVKCWKQIYIIEKDNKYKYVELEIISSLDGAKDEKQYVLENADDTKWKISKLTSNEVLFVDNSK